jgi:predicted amidophosphoribosyltransferase
VSPGDPGVPDAHRPAPAILGADAWLVDDVMTSGATAEACVEALRDLGARAVYVLVVGRAGGGA